MSSAYVYHKPRLIKEGTWFMVSEGVGRPIQCAGSDLLFKKFPLSRKHKRSMARTEELVLGCPVEFLS